ncbi:hypothetical protein [Amycolatopsis taiwanensis]|uniref:hypothetical protein n=1 Tax=Amycolatopsis taiwanensis TaxID=342230 RepID=UPI000484ACF3|nr:hypothetical protein [Amycolatopsis taiwanensis]
MRGDRAAAGLLLPPSPPAPGPAAAGGFIRYVVGWHHPIHVHYGRSQNVRAARAEVLTEGYTRNPERFVRKHPEPPAPPTVA